MTPGQALRQFVRLASSAFVVLLIGACASLPDVSQRTATMARPAATDAPLGRLAAASLDDPSLSAFRLLVAGDEALEARLALIGAAQDAIDLQVYQFRTDPTGLRVMRALRDAAARGVRVRLLIDDLYTAGDDPLWLGLAAHPGVQVRLFNPFVGGRDSFVGRLLDAAVIDERLQRRMHNKLMVVDGALAVAGGRNIGGDYFLRDPQQAFFDIDVLAAGAVIPRMAEAFDAYWNCAYAHDIRTIATAPAAPDALRRALDARLDALPAPDAGPTPRAEGLAREIAAGRLLLQPAPATVAFDRPDKIEYQGTATELAELAARGAQVRLLVASTMRQATQELLVVSPYLIPGPVGVSMLQQFAERGVHVVLLTNSLAATDEPLAYLGYRPYRAAVLRAGVELYEFSPAHGGRVLREYFGGGTVLRLHAKCSVIDRRRLYLGSMNFDPRSRDLNTEFGLLIESPALAAQLQSVIESMARRNAYRLRLDADGTTLHWYAPDGAAAAGEVEPDTDPLSRALLDLIGPFVPEGLL